jgi:transcriptional regulator with XRE-family HTH domain
MESAEKQLPIYHDGVSKYLQAFRYRNGFTQDEAAQALGISKSTLIRYEKAAYSKDYYSQGISFELLLKLAELEELSLVQLIAKLEDKSDKGPADPAPSRAKSPTVTKQQKRLLTALSSVSPATLEDLLDALETFEPTSLVQDPGAWLVEITRCFLRIRGELALKVELSILDAFMEQNKKAPLSWRGDVRERATTLIKKLYNI